MTATPDLAPKLDTAAQVELAIGLQLAVGRLVRHLRRTTPEGAGVTGLSALATLGADGRGAGMRCSDLAAAENVSAPTMTRIVDHLAGLGLAQRVANPDDGRSSLVRLTDAGVQTLAAIRDERGRRLLSRLDRLTPDQLATLRDALPLLGMLAEED